MLYQTDVRVILHFLHVQLNIQVSVFNITTMMSFTHIHGTDQQSNVV